MLPCRACIWDFVIFTRPIFFTSCDHTPQFLPLLFKTYALKWQTYAIHHRGTARVIYIYRTSSRTASLYLYVTTLLSGLLRRPTQAHTAFINADKYFQIQKGIHTDNVSIDRLKPAFIEKPSSHTTSQSTPQVQENLKTPVSLDKPKYTSSGRKVTFPKKFETFYYY